MLGEKPQNSRGAPHTLCLSLRRHVCEMKYGYLYLGASVASDVFRPRAGSGTGNAKQTDKRVDRQAGRQAGEGNLDGQVDDWFWPPSLDLQQDPSGNPTHS